MSPYHALGVSFDTTDAEVRAAYLRLVRDHPPEREPERFHAIQQAYGEIKTEADRLRRAVLGATPEGQPASLEQALLDHCRFGAAPAFPQPDEFRAALRRELLA